MNNIRIKHRWGSQGDEARHLTRFSAEQMNNLKSLQQFLQSKNYNVSLSVFIRAGVLSLIESIKNELKRDTGSGLAVVVMMLERAAERDSQTINRKRNTSTE